MVNTLRRMTELARTEAHLAQFYDTAALIGGVGSLVWSNLNGTASTLMLAVISGVAFLLITRSFLRGVIYTLFSSLLRSAFLTSLAYRLLLDVSTQVPTFLSSLGGSVRAFSPQMVGAWPVLAFLGLNLGALGIGWGVTRLWGRWDIRY